VDSRGRSTRRRSCEIRRWLERRERNTEVGKDGEMKEMENTWERKIHIGRKMKEFNVKGSQEKIAKSSRE